MAAGEITTNAKAVAAELTARGVRAGVRAYAVTRMYGLLAERRIKANASGRPGPRAQTGDYRRSFTTQVSTSRGLVVAVVGTNKAQGRRLEYGFVGADSLGRIYAQPPFPHVVPAFEQTEPEFLEAITAII